MYFSKFFPKTSSPPKNYKIRYNQNINLRDGYFLYFHLEEIESILLTDKNNDVFIVKENVPLRRKEPSLDWKSLHTINQ